MFPLIHDGLGRTGPLPQRSALPRLLAVFAAILALAALFDALAPRGRAGGTLEFSHASTQERR